MRIKGTVIVLILGLILMGLIVLLQYGLAQQREIRFVDQRAVFLPKGKTLKWMSLGHRGLVADWLWIQCVLYYGRRIIEEDNPYYNYALERGTLEEELSELQTKHIGPAEKNSLQSDLAHLLFRAENKSLVSYVYPMLDRITTIDPHFIFPYIFGGLYVLLDTGEVESSVSLLKKGYLANPKSWQFPFYLGWISLMYLNDREKTLSYLEEAIVKEGCPALAGELLINLSSDQGRSEITRRYLEGMLKSSDNPEIREQLLKLLDKMETGRE